MNAYLIKDPTTNASKNNDGIYILIFKTNIEYKKDLKTIELSFGETGYVKGWHVDREDTDKVLRVESTINDPKKIIQIVTQSGFSCEELNN